MIVDGRIKWVHRRVHDHRPATRTRSGPTPSALPDGSGLDHAFNYVRNSVKAVVDAYDGDVTFYVVDQDDPMSAAYPKAFPELFIGRRRCPTSCGPTSGTPRTCSGCRPTCGAATTSSDPDDFYQRGRRLERGAGPAEGAGEPHGHAGPDVGREHAGEHHGNAGCRRYYTLMVQPGTNNLQFVSLRSFVPFSDNDQLKTCRRS